MATNDSYKVGDKIVDFGEIYRIFKIQEKIIHFKPYYKTSENRTLNFSIPIENLDKTRIRRPVDKKELAELMRNLSSHPGNTDFIDIKLAKEILSLNSPEKTANLLKILWLEKNDEDASFTKIKKDAFQMSVERIVQEIALVLGLPLEKADKKVISSLSKWCPAMVVEAV